jgi:hypothetical protein
MSEVPLYEGTTRREPTKWMTLTGKLDLKQQRNAPVPRNGTSSTLSTLNPKSSTRNRNPKPETRNLKPKILNPQPETRNPKPEVRDPKFQTLNPKL